MPDHLKSLEVFCRVARAGSFSTAAVDLNLSQSMVSKHISYLEGHLGVRLLERSARRVRLTPAGSTFLSSCTKIIDALGAAEAALTQDHNAGVVGTLRLHAPIFLAAEYILPAVFSLQKTSPGVTATIDASDRIVNPATEYFDISFTVNTRLDNVDATEIFRTERVLAASPSYLDEYGEPGSLESLASHSCIGLNQSTVRGKSYWNFGTNEDTTFEFEAKLVLNNELAIMHAGVAGMGIVYLPALFMRRALEAGTLRRIDRPFAPPGLVRILATRPLGQAVSRPIEQIMHLVEARLREHSPAFRQMAMP